MLGVLTGGAAVNVVAVVVVVAGEEEEEEGVFAKDFNIARSRNCCGLDID